MLVRARNVVVLPLALLALFSADACGSDEATTPRADAGDGDAADGSLETAADVAILPDARPDLPLGPCAACGDGRSRGPCAAERASCETNAECAKMIACVYGAEPGCPLGETGAACVAECVRTFCSSALSVKLFYRAELCAYCAGSCSPACAGYCAGFIVDAATAECITTDGGLEDAASEIGSAGAGGAAGARSTDAAPE